MTVKALLIGVSNYNKYTCLHACLQDIVAMKRALKIGLNFSLDDISCLGLNGKVYKSEFDNYAKSIQNCNADLFLFYFSGHGGDGNICLTDTDVSIQKIIDILERSSIKHKIVFLDCCYAGRFTINSSVEKLLGQGNIESIIGDGTVVLAACRENEVSFANEYISSFTQELVNALTFKSIIKKGRKSLEEIVNLAKFFMEQKNSQSDTKQQPVYCSSMVGTIYFNVEEYHPYKVQSFYKELEDAIIYKVKPLHSPSYKRYAVDVVLKKIHDINSISTLTHEIQKELQYCNIFDGATMERRFHNKDVNAIYCYFGYDETDINVANYCYRSTWADNKERIIMDYREKRNQSIVNGVLVEINNFYKYSKMLLSMNNMNEKDLIN